MRNILIIILCLISITLLSAFDNESETNIIIRNKIENQKINPLKAGDDIIYCVKSLSEIYENRLFSLAWENKNTLDQLIKSIEDSKHEGLTPNDYHLESLLNMNNHHSKLSAVEKADIDLLATDAFLLYTSHLLSGKVNPISIDSEWYVKRREGNPIALFKQAIKENNISRYIEESLPKHETYLGLKNALLTYENIKLGGGWQVIPNEETLKIGDENDRIVLVKKRLLASKDLSEMNIGNLRQFDDQLLKSVLAFQKRHNLEIDGSISKATIAAMNVSVEDRIEQIKVNLERWRWLPQSFSNYFITVNIADFYVAIYKEGIKQRQHKVIVGKNYRKTPVFSSKMSYLVLNPTWTVPPGIITGDIIPAAKKDGNYLKKKDLTVYDSKGNVIAPSSIDWNSSAAKSYTYRQPAGPDNALGAVKFMFPNSFSVYLHDTPHRDLFEKTERSFSSGCIRVQNPLLLAEYLISDSINWNSNKIQKQVESKNTLTIPLKEQPDIYILYWTAWTNEEGIIQFRKDIYERDLSVSKSLKNKN